MRGKINFSEAESVLAANKKTVIKACSVFINCLKPKSGRKLNLLTTSSAGSYFMRTLFSMFTGFFIHYKT